MNNERTYRAQVSKHQEEIGAWNKRKKAGEKGKPAPKEPMGRDHFQRPAGLYETMFQPLTPFTFKGIIFDHRFHR